MNCNAIENCIYGYVKSRMTSFMFSYAYIFLWHLLESTCILSLKWYAYLVGIKLDQTSQCSTLLIGYWLMGLHSASCCYMIAEKHYLYVNELFYLVLAYILSTTKWRIKLLSLNWAGWEKVCLLILSFALGLLWAFYAYSLLPKVSMEILFLLVTAYASGRMLGVLLLSRSCTVNVCVFWNEQIKRVIGYGWDSSAKDVCS